MKLLIKALGMAAFLGMLSGSLLAQDKTAVETAEMGVQALLDTAASSKEFFLSDRDRYYGEIETVLESFVDFNAVATVVMNRFAGSASEAQTERFADILRTTLTRFYGASLVSYNGQKLVFLPPENPTTDPRLAWSCRVT
jgi:ABC-type transporter MlaC component